MGTTLHAVSTIQISEDLSSSSNDKDAGGASRLATLVRKLISMSCKRLFQCSRKGSVRFIRLWCFARFRFLQKDRLLWQALRTPQDMSIVSTAAEARRLWFGVSGALQRRQSEFWGRVVVVIVHSSFSAGGMTVFQL